MEKKSNQHENNDYQCDYNELNYFDNKKQKQKQKLNIWNDKIVINDS